MEELDKGKKTKIKIGSILIIVFLALYIPSLWNWVYGRTINTEILKIGTVEDSINTDGYLIRDEEVLKSSFSGTSIPAVAEGEHIPVNFSVATVLKKSSENLLTALKEKDLKIIKAQSEKNANQKIFSEDIIKIENEIGEKLNQVISESNTNSLIKYEQVKTDIDTLIQKKATIIGGTSTSDTYINNLKKEKENIQQQIKQNTKEIVSNKSGIISYIVDGYEEILTPDAIKELTPEYLDSIKIKQIANNIVNRDIEAEKPFAKIIKGIECHVVALVMPEKAQLIKVGDNIQVRINEINKIIDGIVDYKSDKKDGKYIISVKFDEGISETAGMRKVNIDLILKYYEGYKVPLSSLKEINEKTMTAKVVIVQAKCASITDITIKGKNDEYAIISNIVDKEKTINKEKAIDTQKKASLNLFDIFVLKPENIQEGQLINQ